MKYSDPKIVLQLLEFGPDDAMCCPSRLTSRVYGPGPDGLRLVATLEQGILSLE